MVEKVTGSLKVKIPNNKVAIENLSGGNQQKVLIGRWLLSNSDIFILDEPTRGIDVMAKYEIYKIMRDLTRQGKTIIMVSSEMPELIGISDRIMVMCEGEMSGLIDSEGATQTAIMEMATTNKIESILVGLAGILEVARTGGANSSYGNAYEFDAISSCVVGGVSLSGGIGKVS